MHQGLVYDGTRVKAFREAISETVRPGDVVVDVGTGTGLLALLCVQAGAARVHAIDVSETCMAWAADLASANGYDDRIVLHTADSRIVTLGERCDVVVCELIGNLGFDEGIVEILFDARRRFLKPGGRVIPQSVELHGAPVDQTRFVEESLVYWPAVSGLDLSQMRNHALRSVYTRDISETEILADPQLFIEGDFKSEIPPQRAASRSFRIQRDGNAHGLGLWMYAQLSERTSVASGPWSQVTSWKGSFLPFSQPVSACVGDEWSIDFYLEQPTRRNPYPQIGLGVDCESQPADRSSGIEPAGLRS